MTLLITGSAGFIGFHLTLKALESNEKIIGIDNINDYYDTSLKNARLEVLFKKAKEINTPFIFIKKDICDLNGMIDIFKEHKPEKVVHLAAQAGVRYSITNPDAYIQSNLVGFSNIIECCRKFKIEHFIYASSSSVYGGNTKMPLSENDNVDHPISLYAATKKSNELISHSYSHLFNLPTTGLRFFTVYGPWGRPDMALFLFTKAIINGDPINVFNNGHMIRDFTYIDDIVFSMLKIIKKPPKSNKLFDKKNPIPSFSWAPYRIFNIGNSSPIRLMNYIEAIEKSLNKKAIIDYLPMQPGDVEATFADTTELNSWIGFKPQTSINDGINSFVNWYKEVY